MDSIQWLIEQKTKRQTMMYKTLHKEELDCDCDKPNIYVVICETDKP
jgi:hypothetical protein